MNLDRVLDAYDELYERKEKLQQRVLAGMRHALLFDGKEPDDLAALQTDVDKFGADCDHFCQEIKNMSAQEENKGLDLDQAIVRMDNLKKRRDSLVQNANAALSVGLHHLSEQERKAICDDGDALIADCDRFDTEIKNMLAQEQQQESDSKHTAGPPLPTLSKLKGMRMSVRKDEQGRIYYLATTAHFNDNDRKPQPWVKEARELMAPFHEDEKPVTFGFVLLPLRNRSTKNVDQPPLQHPTDSDGLMEFVNWKGEKKFRVVDWHRPMNAGKSPPPRMSWVVIEYEK